MQWACLVLTDIAGALCYLLHSSGTRGLEEVCLQVTDLLPGLRKLRNLLPEHGCLLLSPGNFWQNDRERFHADPDIIGTIHQHEPKTLQTSATLKGTPRAGSPGTCKGCLLVTMPSLMGALADQGLPLVFLARGGKGSLALQRLSSSVSACWFLSADLLFGVPGKYSGVSLYTRKRMVSYTITLVFQRYHAK